MQDPIAAGWLRERLDASRQHGIHQLWDRAVARDEVMFAQVFIAVQHADLYDTATSAATGDTPAGDQDTGSGKARAHHRPARQAPIG